MPPRLTMKQGTQVIKEILLEKDSYTVGRMPDNDIELRDTLVSRRHTEFIKRGTKYTLYDLGSSNGTYVNNKKVDVKVLENGDEVLIGETVLVFHDDSIPTEVPTATSQPKSDEDLIASMYGGSEIIKPVTHLPKIYQMDARESIAQGISWVSISKESAEAAKSNKERENVALLYNMTQVVMDPASPLDRALDEALKAILEIINAERGVILVLPKGGKEMVARVARHRTQGRIAAEDVKVSRSIAHKALDEKVSIITNDAKYDPRFQAGMSIIQYNIRSAMCVPLWEKREVFGVIYVDNLLKTHAFQEGDSDILTALARSIAMRIKQELLYEDLQHELIVRANLSRYHSPDVVDMIIKENKEIVRDVAEKDVTVIFVDIVGFTAQSEQRKPREVADMLTAYFETMTQVIFDFQGSVNKFIGDGILALFGAPREYPDHASRACRAAVKMMMEHRRKQDGAVHKYDIKIGINTGQAVVGNVGPSNRLEYAVLGDIVNVAARLEKYAKANQIVVGDATFQRVKSELKLERLGAAQLKGKEKELDVYLLDWNVPQGKPLPAK